MSMAVFSGWSSSKSRASYLLIQEGHSDHGSAEGLQNTQSRNNLYSHALMKEPKWYSNPMGPNTLSALPLNPTKVPRRVYRFCDAESETERSEYGAPTTSNRASSESQC